MSEFITVQVGQCGNQIGSAFWPLALQEHGIATSKPISQQQRSRYNDAFHSFFWSPSDVTGASYKTLSDLENAKVKARAVLIDMEDSVVARFRKGPLRKLFDETLLLTNYPGSGNNWAEGHHCHGRAYESRIVEVIRRAVERCDYLHGFLLMFSVGGGTGSGLGTATLKLLSDYFPDVERFATCVYPSGHEDVVTAPYNVVLATNILLEYATCVLPADNKSLLDICAYLQNKKESNESAKAVAASSPYEDMNSVIVNMLLNFTSGSRFPGSLNVDMSELSTNMVPYPKLNFLSCGLTPLGFSSSQVLPVPKQVEPWARDHQLLKIDPLAGTLLGATLLSRGNVTLSDIRYNVSRLQNRGKFIPWNHDAIKVGLCSVAPTGHPSAHLSLLNSTSMGGFFSHIGGQFDRLFRRKAHIHHYLQVDGFSNSEFVTSRQSLLDCTSHYQHLTTTQNAVLDRLQVV
ncbi:Tubulin epsilon chain [Frankliniella fusca]|uniref:Tubulin epsilon chain n=1 Tax=Frankliniella fusca TaxID=407009 RepID=A0AAE1H598_9NEOP|nr:Tubulin epsilon chain [Frankliniella fusca]